VDVSGKCYKGAISMHLSDLDTHEKLQKHLSFIIEIDKIKHILRKTKLFHENRYENDAEHSWTICIMALLLQEYADVAVNIDRVIQMLLIHDIVEIDTGDTFLYSDDRDMVIQNETIAARRIFGMLDIEMSEHFMQLWEEFTERKSPEAKFAAVFDRLQPILQNYISKGATWKDNNITYSMVIEKNKHIAQGSKAIWDFVVKLLDNAVKLGYLKADLSIFP
jgi:putative hydrolase of HD superfamily